MRRRHLTVNPATIAKAPKIDEEEVEPYTVEEVQRLLVEADKHRNTARWVIASPSVCAKARFSASGGLTWTSRPA
jgi:hypothetical protein